jgi:hypothetical protein
MSSAAQTKIFGLRVGIDPKILVACLIGLAALLFWYNSRGDETTAGSSSTPTRNVAEPAVSTPARTVKSRLQADRRRGSKEDRGTLRLRAVDPTRGDVDPTLRLDFLDRLSKVQEPKTMRNLFETGPAALIGGGQVPNRIIPVKAPVMAPPMGPTHSLPNAITPNIPLKYYGFAKPLNSGEGSRGFFMDGDNVLVAVEGQLVQQRYLVVQLTPTTARMEDTQIKMQQTLQVVPEAIMPAGGAAGQPQTGMFPGMNRNPDEDQQ